MKNLDEREYNNVYAIPANYTDSGKLLGGMIDTRNILGKALVRIFPLDRIGLAQ